MSPSFRDRLADWHGAAAYLTDIFLDLVLPPVCANCGQLGELLCSKCWSAIVWLKEPLCQSCGRPHAPPFSLCSGCQERPIPMQHIRTATLYTGPVPGVLHKLKYEGFFALALPLAELMRVAWQKWQHPVDLVVPIPLHPARQRERGYNQVELLVRALQQPLDWDIDPAALKRIRRTRPQVGLGVSERRTNVDGAFAADATRVADRRILLVDDVRTTGSTLVAAAEALLTAGASSVTAYCLTGAMGDQDITHL